MTGTRDRRPSVALVLLMVYLLFLAYVFLSPSSEMQSTAVSVVDGVLSRLGFPESFSTPERLEFVCNALIVVPVPVLGSLVLPGWSWRDWTAVGFVLAGCVEVTQGLLLPDRDASHADVVANTLGALMGACLAAVLRGLAGGFVWGSAQTSRDTQA
jgi:glycopeptide antibiotics resistance protein